MLRQLFRIQRLGVVTGHDRSGKAVVLFDSDAPKVKRPSKIIESTLLWTTDGTPVNNTGDADLGDRDIGIGPPLDGTVFRIVEFWPEGEGASDLDYIGKAGGAHAPEGARHPGMHKTDSIDYAVVMTGEIEMLLDDSEVHLKAGDVVVQRGTVHAWANRGTEPCRIAFILIGAEPAP